MDGEFPWIYVAMIVIAFVSWIFNRIQEATAGRQRAEETRRRKENGDFDIDEDEDYFEEQEPGPARETPTSGEDAMRKLMEALGGTVVEAPKSPSPEQSRQPPARQSAAVASPPPVPVELVSQRMSAEERAALERIKKRNEIKVVPKKKAKSTLGEMSIADLVRDPDGIRKAILLREILDRPRSERPWE
jgi:hypothetical protein